jgi:hypothetical protein
MASAICYCKTNRGDVQCPWYQITMAAADESKQYLKCASGHSGMLPNKAILCLSETSCQCFRPKLVTVITIVLNQLTFTWFTTGGECIAHSVDHLEDDPVLKAPSLRDFKALHSSGNPLKSICSVCNCKLTQLLMMIRLNSHWANYKFWKKKRKQKERFTCFKRSTIWYTRHWPQFT